MHKTYMKLMTSFCRCTMVPEFFIVFTQTGYIYAAHVCLLFFILSYGPSPGTLWTPLVYTINWSHIHLFKYCIHIRKFVFFHRTNATPILCIFYSWNETILISLKIETHIWSLHYNIIYFQDMRQKKQS
jgi:hypothetical protein